MSTVERGPRHNCLLLKSRSFAALRNAIRLTAPVTVDWRSSSVRDVEPPFSQYALPSALGI